MPKKFKNFGPLPGKPSELIYIRFNDMGQLLSRGGYTVNMASWVYKTTHTCHICQAGAVMMTTLKAEPVLYKEIVPSNDLINEAEGALMVLNSLRMGDVRCAFLYLDIITDDDLTFDRIITQFEDNPAQYYTDMMTLAKDLEKAGY